MDIVFFGSGAFGVPTLAALAQQHRLRGVVTQPDKPAGRGGTLTPTPIAQWCAQHAPGVPVIKPAKVNAPEVVEAVRAWPADAWVVIAFGQYLGKKLLDAKFAINLHASLLPRWRGAAPINACILDGDVVTGNSVITLAEKMDAGLVLAQSKRPRDPSLTAGELHDLLSADGPALVESVLAAHASGTVRGTAQDESLVTIAPKLSKSDGWVDWSHNAERVRDRVHGLTPWPGIALRIAGEDVKVLRVGTIQTFAPHGKQPGTLYQPIGGHVACGVGTTLQLISVQPAGKKPMAWADFARGRTLSAAEVVRSTAPVPSESQNNPSGSGACN